MAVLEGLEPRGVLHWFEELCRIPHGSGNTQALSDYLVQFGRDRGLAVQQDALGNVILCKPGTPGYENAPAVMLQGHMDMVCEMAPGCTKDMAREGLDLVVDGDVIYAEGTTLGADDGIAVAMGLALLDSHDIPHPPLEVVLTVDEEVGMKGATGIDLSGLKSRLLLNLDSETEGEITAGCAGAARVDIAVPVKRDAFPGETVEIKAFAKDPGDTMTLTWWRYREADTCKQEISLLQEQNEDGTSGSVRFTVPENALKGDTIHLVLTCRDAAHNEFPEYMTAYARVIVTVV